ncbi:hypothetical protein CYMTET_29642 [Cymbomonas tetramitiformis]|uniref:C3H1-type domain-containing protein n=1 Tax=Cymbomonas tetramitiformis TaxID=36881 RepID=A0AAE0FL05_9CHLO|nr:hypothetical protein CYMTET_29642 [Cymbomonas tetramitiformis]
MRCSGAAAAAAVDRCVRWVKEAKLRSTVEMLEYSLSGGEFTAAVRDEQGVVTEPATLTPPTRRGPNFCAVLAEAVDQCVKALVGELDFKIPEVLQRSASANCRSDRRAREETDENADEEEEAPEEEIFADADEDVIGPKQGLMEEKNRDTGHRNEPGAEKGKKDGICDFLQKKEGCKKGRDCNFMHVYRRCKSPEHGQGN